MALVLLTLLASQAAAYGPAIHAGIVKKAAEAVCAGSPEDPFCAELSRNVDFLQYGAIMEDAGKEGFREVFKGVQFQDEEGGSYGPCRTYVLAGKNYMFCNHYFFIASYQAGGREGACGVSIMGATDQDCPGETAFKWESARQRGLRLWKEKALPSYFGNGPDDKARAYYWLGRVAHLLADVSVPGHIIPHKLGHIEFEHRVFEYEAAVMADGPSQADQLPSDVDGLFTGLASRTLKTHDEVRSEACRADAGLPGCRDGRASPSRPLESWLLINNVRLITALIDKDQTALSRPEIMKERELARRQLETIKPLTDAYTEKLLELFGALTRMQPQEVPMAVQPPGPDTAAIPLAPPDFGVTGQGY